MKVCPKNPDHKQFITTAHEVHDWVVDGNGNFEEDLGCSETAHGPNSDNIWTCRKCGAEAVEDSEIEARKALERMDKVERMTVEDLPLTHFYK